MSSKLAEQLTWGTLCAWAPILWFVIAGGGFMFVQASLHDWPCGPPGHEACNFQRNFSVLLACLNVTAVMSVALCLWACVLAFRRKLGPLGVAGLVCSLIGGGILGALILTVG